jgi:SAM-dependent methyltransferase
MATPADTARRSPAIARLARLAASPPASLVFGATIGLSAFLLFTAEPMTGRIAQPAFGGAPAVWATVLVFFQLAVLLGYAYAHLVATRLTVRTGAVLHLALAAIALVLTVAAPRGAPVPIDAPIPVPLTVLLLLAVLVGPATFVMSATTPLVSSWYARERRALDSAADPRDPYWLYAVSNFGSLVSLLAYPLLIQPLIGLSAQRAGWTIGFGLLIAGLGAAALRVVSVAAGSSTAERATAEHERAVSSPCIATGRRLRWILLAAVPSGLLAAVTNLVTTDLLSAPLLWVVPLAIYLGTFVVAFSVRGRRALPGILLVAPAALTLLWIPLGLSSGWPILPLLLVEYVGLAVVATALHGRLAEARPPAAGLTGFYLTMSAGGVLGGAFVGLLAPAVFPSIWEYPVLIAGAALALALTAPPPTDADRARSPLSAMVHGWVPRLLPYLVVAALLVLTMRAMGSPATDQATRWLVIGGLVLLVGGQPRVFAATTTAALVMVTLVIVPTAVFRDRSFFGVVQVLRDDAAQLTYLLHGTTSHGIQSTDPARAREPSSYFARSGPMGDLFGALADRPPMAIRVVGLGAGSLAAYARPDDALTFFEIDPLVARVAGDPSLFTYLRDAGDRATVRVGDGRLLLRGEPDASIDLVILDAFTSDALPVHLVTAEALADAARVLRPDGVLAVHVSNRYYDLEPPVAAGLEAAGLEVQRIIDTPAPDEAAAGASTSHWLVATRPGEASDVRDDLASRGWSAPRAGEPLVDDFADLLRYLRLQ